MPRILTVVGARPQFIKAAPVSNALANVGLNETLVHTGQHFGAMMSDVFFDELSIQKPAYNLEIASLNHGAMTGRMLEKLEDTMMAEKPDMMLVYGDTNSTLAAALAAAKLHIPIAHVEAGLRSFNRAMPEEINRILTDHCSDLLFTSTPIATRNLQNEGLPDAAINQVGDVMYDAALYFDSAAKTRKIGPASFGLKDKGYVLATVHRQENTDDPQRLKAVLCGLQKVAASIPVVFPLHPRTHAKIKENGFEGFLEGIKILDPLGYLEIITLEKGAVAIATDSGGVQKETFFHKVPCVTLRDETEWMDRLS